MNSLMITRLYYPHIGGVEKHVASLSKNLIKRGHDIVILTEKYELSLPNREIVDGVEVIRFWYPHIRIFGLIYIWFWMFKNRSLIEKSDIIHCHDVFIWYLPFRFLYPKKKVYTTFHGWEGKFPIPWKNVIFKRIANRLSTGSIAVGKYIEKYYKIKSNIILYGGIEEIKNRKTKKIKNSVIFVGRLEKDTGLIEFLHWFRSLVHGYKECQIEFVGDGSLRNECEKFGKVHGFVDPMPFLKKAEICIPGGYLSYLEARQVGCKIMTFYNNPLKKDYWEEIEKIDKFPNWDQVADEYINLYNSTK